MNKVLFVDTETTGLTPETDDLLEIGAKVVDYKFNILGEIKHVIRYNSLPPMLPWCTATHGASGLLDKILSDKATYLKTAEESLCAFVDKHWPDNVIESSHPGNPPEGRVIIAGNGIHFDRRVIRRWMPALNRRLYHRMLDVTAVHTAMQIFRAGRCPEKMDLSKMKHRVFEDIDVSIDLLRELVQ